MSIAEAIGVGVRRYQDLVAWQLANELKIRVYELIDTSPTAMRDARFVAQIKDSASSGPTNIAEGFGAYDHPQAARYALIARSSLMETHNHLNDGVDRKHWSRSQAEDLQALATRAIAATTKWLAYLSTTDAPRRWPDRKRRPKL
jgi:four helix bundle protein